MFGGFGVPVATPPGATEVTRMPSGPHMNAAAFVTPMVPCLLAVHALPRRPLTCGRPAVARETA